MAKFHFTLEPVLQQRLRTEQAHQRLVAELESERLRVESRIRECQLGISAERATQRTHLAAGDLYSARSQAIAALHLDEAARRSVLELAGIHKRLERERAELLEAMKARKAVELLKDRRYQEWKHAQARRELAAADELATMQAARRERVS